MNAQRRKELVRIREALDALLGELQAVAEAEREAFDNLSEGLQASERGQELEGNADTLDGIADSLNDVASELGAIA